MRTLFGTDGIRGRANVSPFTPEILTRLGQAIGFQFMRGNHRHRVVIGKDTRLSGYMVESALAAGFTSVGMDVTLVGPLPTPAVALLTRSLKMDLGVMISASHNPFEDNGIKLFGPDGFKLSDEIESQIEDRFSGSLPLVHPPFLGQIAHLPQAAESYLASLKASLPQEATFQGVRIVVDCGHGAAYKVGPRLLEQLGATVISLAVAPNGMNINQGCGATSPALMAQTVKEKGAHIGVSFDGDADRAVFCDETGAIVDGDQIMALMATTWQHEGRLNGQGIVATHMSNLGLERYLDGQGLRLVRTAVGDRYVMEKMREDRYNLGGEQSGHIILSDYATAGDGLLTALHVVNALVTIKKRASHLLSLFTPLPQILKNVSLCPSLLTTPEAKAMVSSAQTRLGTQGRLLIRPSGTEKLLRIMAEGEDRESTEEVVESIASALLLLSQKKAIA